MSEVTTVILTRAIESRDYRLTIADRGELIILPDDQQRLYGAAVVACNRADRRQRIAREIARYRDGFLAVATVAGCLVGWWLAVAATVAL